MKRDDRVSVTVTDPHGLSALSRDRGCRLYEARAAEQEQAWSRQGDSRSSKADAGSRLPIASHLLWRCSCPAQVVFVLVAHHKYRAPRVSEVGRNWAYYSSDIAGV